jgi:hypothetical protein
MRKALAVVLAGLLTGPPASLFSDPALGVIEGFVTLEGRPLQGVGLALVDLESGRIQRVTTKAEGAFRAAVAPGRYIVTTENSAGLVVGRGPALIPVGSGQVASARIDLTALAVPLLQEQPGSPSAPAPAAQDAQAPASPTGAPVINHDAVTCFIAGEFPLLDAQIEPAASVARARVYFRSNLGNASYYVEMTQSDGKFQGKLPRPRLEASPITYYIQATSTEFGESQTPEIQAIVVKEAKDCEDRKVAAIGPPGPVQVFSAATGAAISPAGFAAGGLAIAGGALALIIGGAAAAGIAAAVNTFNPSPPPSPSPSPVPTPTPTPRPTPRPSPSPSPTPGPTPCPPPGSPPQPCK